MAFKDQEADVNTQLDAGCEELKVNRKEPESALDCKELRSVRGGGRTIRHLYVAHGKELEHDVWPETNYKTPVRNRFSGDSTALI